MGNDELRIRNLEYAREMGYKHIETVEEMMKLPEGSLLLCDISNETTSFDKFEHIEYWDEERGWMVYYYNHAGQYYWLRFAEFNWYLVK